jgi:hypothetical protein
MNRSMSSSQPLLLWDLELACTFFSLPPQRPQVRWQ